MRRLLVTIGAASAVVSGLRAVHVALSVGASVSLLGTEDVVLRLGLEASRSGRRVGAVAAAAGAVRALSSVRLGLLLNSLAVLNILREDNAMSSIIRRQAIRTSRYLER